MIFLEVSLDIWCSKYGIEAVTGRCSCGQEHITNIPYITKDHIGLTSSLCSCGILNPVSTYIKRVKNERV